jgi:hypothetical protein
VRARPPTSPEDIRRYTTYAIEHVACKECDVLPGVACTSPGRGRPICKARYIRAAIAVRRERKAATLTDEQKNILASLPRIPRSELEACRTPRGGYRFTREWFTAHGISYPPPHGWRAAVEYDDGQAPQ